MDGGQSQVEGGGSTDRQRVDPALDSFNASAQALDRPWRLVRGAERGFALVRHPQHGAPEILFDLSGARTAFEAVAKAGMFLNTHTTE